MKPLNKCQIAEVEVIYKTKVDPRKQPSVTSSKDAFIVFREIWSNKLEYIEEFNMLILNKANRVMGYSNISKGGTDITIIDPKVVFATAITLNASAIIIAHNHPSGRIRPSNVDIQVTNKLVAGGEILNIPILDHLIITPHSYYSFADEGLLEK